MVVPYCSFHVSQADYISWNSLPCIVLFRVGPLRKPRALEGKHETTIRWHAACQVLWQLVHRVSNQWHHCAGTGWYQADASSDPTTPSSITPVSGPGTCELRGEAHSSFCRIPTWAMLSNERQMGVPGCPYFPPFHV